MKKFKYNLTFDWNFRYRHEVYDHNNLRHAQPSFEDTWVLDRWECWVVAFILDISGVNAFLFYANLSSVGYNRR